MAALLDVRQGATVVHIGSDTGGDHCEAALSLSGRASSDASAASSLSDDLQQRSPDSPSTRGEPVRPPMASDPTAKAPFSHAIIPQPACSIRPTDAIPAGGTFRQHPPCHFNILVAGACNLGKTRFITNLTDLVGSSCQLQRQRPPSPRAAPGSPIRSNSRGGGGGAVAPRGLSRIATLERNPSRLCTTLAPLELAGDSASSRRQLHVTLVDVPGYDEEPNKVLHLAKLLEYVLRQRERDYRTAFRASSLGGAGGGDRNPLPQSVSLCLYFLPPREVSATDLTFMAAISREVPLLPVLALGSWEGAGGAFNDPEQQQLTALRRSIVEALRGYTRNGKPAPIIPLELDPEAVDSLLPEPARATLADHPRAPEVAHQPAAANDHQNGRRRRRSSSGSSLQVLVLGQSDPQAHTEGADGVLPSSQQHSDAVLLRRLLHQSVEPVLRGATERFEDFCRRYEAYGQDLMGLLAEAIDPYEEPLLQAIQRDAAELRNRKISEAAAAATAAAIPVPSGSPTKAASAASPSPTQSPREAGADAVAAAAAAAATAEISPPGSKVASPIAQQPSLPHTPEQQLETGAVGKRERGQGDGVPGSALPGAATAGLAPATPVGQSPACPTVLITTSCSRAPMPVSEEPAAAVHGPDASDASVAAAGVAAAVTLAEAEEEPSTGSDVDRVVTAIEGIVAHLSEEVEEDTEEDTEEVEGQEEEEGEQAGAVATQGLGAEASAAAAKPAMDSAARVIMTRLTAGVLGSGTGEAAAEAPPHDALVQRALGSVRAAAATLAAVAQGLAPAPQAMTRSECDGAGTAAATAMQLALQRALASVFAASVTLAPVAEVSSSRSDSADVSGGSIFIAVQPPLQRALAATVDAAVALAPVAEPTETAVAEADVIRATVQRALASVSTAVDALTVLPQPSTQSQGSTTPSPRSCSDDEEAAAVVHIIVNRAVKSVMQKADLEGADAAASPPPKPAEAGTTPWWRLVHLGLSTLFAVWERARAATNTRPRALRDGTSTTSVAAAAGEPESDLANDNNTPQAAVVKAVVRRVFAAVAATDAASPAAAASGEPPACCAGVLLGADGPAEAGEERMTAVVHDIVHRPLAAAVAAEAARDAAAIHDLVHRPLAAAVAAEADGAAVHELVHRPLAAAVRAEAAEDAAVVHNLVHRPLMAAVAAEADAALVHAVVHRPLAAAVAAEVEDAAAVHNLVRRALAAAVAAAEEAADDDVSVVRRVLRRAFAAAVAAAEGMYPEGQVVVPAQCGAGAVPVRRRTWQQLGAEFLAALPTLPTARRTEVPGRCLNGSAAASGIQAVSAPGNAEGGGSDIGDSGSGGAGAGVDVVSRCGVFPSGASSGTGLGIGLGVGVVGLSAGTVVLMALRHYRQPPPQ